MLKLKTYIKEIDTAYIGVGLHIDSYGEYSNKIASLVIASTDNLKKTEDFLALSDTWYVLTGHRTNLVNPYVFIRFFREKWPEILTICKDEGAFEIIAEPDVPSLIAPYKYLKKLGFVWDREYEVYKYVL